LEPTGSVGRHEQEGTDVSKTDKRAGGGSEMTKFYWILGAVAVIGIGAVGYSVGSGKLGKAAYEPVEVEGLDDMSTLVEMAQGVTRGEPSAPVTIVEFGDYQCPACGGYAMQIQPRVDLAFVETGKAKFVFYDFPLTRNHPNAFLAARAARCAGEQGQYWQYHDHLYRNQASWSAKQHPVSDFVDYAAALGMDRGPFEACLDSDKYADIITANMRLGL